ncbi:MAG TPA: diguanylate cyclase [Plantibacter sp.]|uniref:GGDEF domain-containing protein n=1 Tax=Plantibacter sp. TaxID=1871045 RepID=UPI002CE58B61|nr:diguanylate cyclase [Plantibacter sp.]
MSILIIRSQAQARVALEQRYELRAALSSRFVAAYVSDIQQREAEHAADFLASANVTPDRFGLVSKAFGFDAAVLLDARGRVLQALPSKPELIGADLAGKYRHLQTAVTGRAAVSGVVPSAANAEPIVAFAVPFGNGADRRVFSGGARVARSPMAAFLTSSSPFKGARAYLLDGAGHVIVAGGATAGAPIPPAAYARSGAITLESREYRYASHKVAGSPWRLLTLAPADELYAPIAGLEQWIPWAVLLAFGLASAAALWLLGKLTRQRAVLTHLASHDPLTGTVNRRSLEQAFARLSADATRTDRSVGVLAIDLDHFKEVNDVYGHAAGDELLRGVAETLQAIVRPSDVVARVGGDEFVILLADVDEERAHEIAGRVVATLDEHLFPILDVVELRARCSAGIALAEHDDPIARALARADNALYEAKGLGRNGLRTAIALRNVSAA